MAGIEDAEDFALGDSGEGRTTAELRGVCRAGAWDEGVINAGAAKIDGCPGGFEDAYYASYDRAACMRVLAIIEDREIKTANFTAELST